MVQISKNLKRIIYITLSVILFAVNVNSSALLNSYQFVSGEEWSPSDLSDLVLWLDFSAESTGNLSTITDLSANEHVFSQGTGTRQPVVSANIHNSLNMAYFDGTDDQLWCNTGEYVYESANGWTIIYVIQTLTTSNEYWWWNESDWGAGQQYFSLQGQPSSSKIYRLVNRGSGDGFQSGNSTNVVWTDQQTQFVIADGTKTTFDIEDSDGNSDSTISLNSASMTDHDGQTIGGLYLTNYAKGYIGEIIIMENRITSGERSSLKAYLLSKWNLE